MKSTTIVYLSIIFSYFCLQYDYLVTLAMEKYYGEIFYTHLELNTLVTQNYNIYVLLLPLFILSLGYILYQLIWYGILKKDKSNIIIDLMFILEFMVIGIIHLNGGLSWFLNGWF